MDALSSPDPSMVVLSQNLPSKSHEIQEADLEMSVFRKHSKIESIALDQIEKELKPTIARIRQEINQQLDLKHIAYLTTCELFKSFKGRFGITAGKSFLVGLSLLTLYPLVVGSIACFNSYRLFNPADLFSTDLEVVNPASQFHANTGHGVGYLWEGLAINAVTWKFLLNPIYERVIASIIYKTYTPYIENASLSQQQSDFLYKRREFELAKYGFHSSYF